MPEIFLPLLVVVSTPPEAKTILTQILKTEFNWSAGLDHPDVVWLNQPNESLSIERVRELPQLVASKPLGDRRFLLLLDLQTASIPAQNALLKHLEEPPVANHFVILTTTLEKIAPTILSRVKVLYLSDDESAPAKAEKAGKSQATSSLYQTLNTGSYAQAIELAANYTDRDLALELTQHLSRYLHSQLTSDSGANNSQKLAHLQAALKAQKMLDQNVNVRLVIEDLFFQLKQKGQGHV